MTGKDIQYYEIVIKAFTQQVYPNLGPARLVGYDGISPGPTFVVPRGTEVIVRFINNATAANSVHLHGSPSRAPFDGWAEDTTSPGQYKDYYYPNNQNARLLWYHDHAISHVRALYFSEEEMSNLNFRLQKMHTLDRLVHTLSRTPPRTH